MDLVIKLNNYWKFNVLNFDSIQNVASVSAIYSKHYTSVNVNLIIMHKHYWQI